MRSPNAGLAPVRDGEYADAAFLATLVVGAAVATQDWRGLILGGVLVGLVAPTLGRALVYGLYLGTTILAGFAVVLWWAGVLSKYIAMGELFYFSLAAGLVLPMLSAVAARGLT